MKKVFISIFMLIFCSALIAESPFKVTNKKVLNDDQNHLVSPQWSPDGGYLAAAGVNYGSIWIYDFEQATWSKLVEENGSGWDFAWSPDSKKIAFRANVFEKRRKKTTIKVVEVASKRTEQLVEYDKNYSTPDWITNDVVAFVHDREFKTVRATDKKDDQQATAVKQNPIVLSMANGHVARNSEGTQKLLDDTQWQIFNPAYSPDGTLMVYEKPGGGIYTLDIETNQETEIGNGEMPAWSPDGKYIVYATPKDDGHQILSSDLWICDVSGAKKQQITKNEDMKEMHPAWSPDGTTIACDDEGKIILLSIQKQKTKKIEKVKETRRDR